MKGSGLKRQEVGNPGVYDNCQHRAQGTAGTRQRHHHYMFTLYMFDFYWFANMVDKRSGHRKTEEKVVDVVVMLENV